MKPKQLANVLIKVLGLSISLYAIPSCVSAIIFAVMHPNYIGVATLELSGSGSTIRPWVQLAVGIATMIVSQTMAGWLFKSDADETGVPPATNAQNADQTQI